MKPARENRPRGAGAGRTLVVGLALAAGLALPAVPAVSGAAAKPAAKAKTKAKKRGKRQGRHWRRHRTPRPTYWGAWIGDQITGEQAPWDMRPVDTLQGLLGKGLSLVALSSPFADCSGGRCSFFPFPAGVMENVRRYGAIPFFGWASQATSSDPAGATVMPDYQLSDLIAGRYDDYIRQFASEARAWGHPFFLRFDWEMNGNWFPWSEQVNGNRPGEFVAAWRHVHDVFTAAGATNATWVWCPYAEVKRRFGSLPALYPGDEYVDWTCLDGFNWARNPTNPHPWRSFASIFRRSYRHIVRHIAPSKPMLLAELASTGGHRAKATWIRNMFRSLRTEFRRVRGLIWFDQVDRDIEWPLESSPAAARAFARGVRHRAYRGNAFAGLPGGPIGPAR